MAEVRNQQAPLMDEKSLVTGCNVFFTAIGLFFYLSDMVTDISTSIIYACNRQWWRAVLTLAIVYGAIIINTVVNWLNKEIHCIGSADWLRYFGSLLINWPNVKQYGRLCFQEWKLCKSPESNAHLVPDWQQRRLNVARLKYTEGLWEACPQAILQLCLLLPDLYGILTWTDYFRIVSSFISLCTAGAALVNLEKSYRIANNRDLPTHELIVLHVWAVPGTVSRLLSMALLLTVHPYWCLTGVSLHLILHALYWYRTVGVLQAMHNVVDICMVSLNLLISPFVEDDSIIYRRGFHVIHFLGNTVATVVWALGTPLVCAHPTLYSAVICFNAAMFVLGLSGWIWHEKYWRGK